MNPVVFSEILLLSTLNDKRQSARPSSTIKGFFLPIPITLVDQVKAFAKIVLASSEDIFFTYTLDMI